MDYEDKATNEAGLTKIARLMISESVFVAGISGRQDDSVGEEAL